MDPCCNETQREDIVCVWGGGENEQQSNELTFLFIFRMELSFSQEAQSGSKFFSSYGN